MKKELSIEHRLAIANGLKGKKKAESHVRNMIAAITGRKLSESHKKKISDSIKGNPKPRKVSFEDRFWTRVSKSDGCWEWNGSFFSGRKYGQVKYRGKTRQVHRVSWEINFGEIPSGLCVCHHCDNPPCVRPDHLFLGTIKHNVMDSVRKGRNYFINSPPMRDPVLLEKVISQKRGVLRPYMKRGIDGRYI